MNKVEKTFGGNAMIQGIKSHGMDSDQMISALTIGGLKF